MIKGPNGIGVDKVQKYLANLKDIQLASCFDAWNELRECDEVYNAIWRSIFGDDFELFYKLLIQECSRRFSLAVHQEFYENDRRELEAYLAVHPEEAEE